MEILRNGITLIVPNLIAEQLVLERFNAPELSPSAPEILLDLDPPTRIGEAWQGGIYAGIARGREGAPDYYLIVGPEHETDIDWNAAAAWAKDLALDGWKDFALPTRKEQALCFANVPELFKDRAYWSGEQHASYSLYAWYQNFNYGNQGTNYKCDELRARAVRRLAIQ